MNIGKALRTIGIGRPEKPTPPENHKEWAWGDDEWSSQSFICGSYISDDHEVKPPKPLFAIRESNMKNKELIEKLKYEIDYFRMLGNAWKNNAKVSRGTGHSNVADIQEARALTFLSCAKQIEDILKEFN